MADPPNAPNTEGSPPATIAGIRLRIPRVKRARSRDESRDLGFAWVLAALTGFVLIRAFGAGTGLIRASLPVAAMVAYMLFGLSRQTRNLTRLADSVYFLGFLWTLFALIDTLIGRGSQITAAQVFSVFGYALVTTAAGMFFRLALVQFQRTTDDVITDAQEDVDIHVRELVASLRRASQGVDALATRLTAGSVRVDAELTKLEERLGGLSLPSDALAREVGRVGAEMTKAAAAFEQRIGGAADKVDTRIKVLFDGLSRLPAAADVDTLAAQLNRSAQQLTQEYGELRRVASSVEERAAAIDRNMGRVQASFEQLPGRLDLVARSAARIQGALSDVLAFVGARTTGGRGEGTRFTKK